MYSRQHVSSKPTSIHNWLANVSTGTIEQTASRHTQVHARTRTMEQANQSTYTCTRMQTDHGASQPVNIHKHTHANGSYGKLVSRTQARARARTRTIEHVIRLHVQHLQIAAAQHHILHDEEPQSRGHPQLALRVRLEDVGCHCSERSSPERTKPRSVSKNR